MPIREGIMPHRKNQRAVSDYKKEPVRDVIELTSTDKALIEAIKQMSQGAAMFEYITRMGAMPSASQIVEISALAETLNKGWDNVDRNYNGKK